MGCLPTEPAHCLKDQRGPLDCDRQSGGEEREEGPPTADAPAATAGGSENTPEGIRAQPPGPSARIVSAWGGGDPEERGGIRPRNVGGAAGAGLLGPAAGVKTGDERGDASLPAALASAWRRRRGVVLPRLETRGGERGKAPLRAGRTAEARASTAVV
ncbi:hypothetical protein NDU88_003232 [Pleurodeles waltl]|uniref:Uncharacterized protein n=1 Tax=Pleurodeles waltl TaxID=8319 RepID=A0AAV7SEP8_PLEWA|nr:hypothetical protein NDU88_003232 [Pleurodeles waltl]